MSEGRIKIGEKIRDFTLENTQGDLVMLSDFAGEKNIYLVFNRGFF
jgi:peroxiredoxin